MQIHLNSTRPSIGLIKIIRNKLDFISQLWGQKPAETRSRCGATDFCNPLCEWVPSTCRCSKHPYPKFDIVALPYDIHAYVLKQRLTGARSGMYPIPPKWVQSRHRAPHSSTEWQIFGKAHVLNIDSMLHSGEVEGALHWKKSLLTLFWGHLAQEWPFAYNINVLSFMQLACTLLPPLIKTSWLAIIVSFCILPYVQYLLTCLCTESLYMLCILLKDKKYTVPLLE
jgi:hypothetical protein